MSTALAVFHGPFGRVGLYSLDRAMVPHGQREGHLILHLRDPAGNVVVDDVANPLSAGQAVAISPWQTRCCRPLDATQPTLAVVLQIRPAWFPETSRRAQSGLRFGRVGVEVTDFLARMVCAVADAMLDPDQDDPLIEQRICDLTQVAFDQSWQWTDSGPAFTGPILPRCDHRSRNALRLLQDCLGDAAELDEVAREVGLSRRKST